MSGGEDAATAAAGIDGFFGMQFGSFRAGALYPISTHIAFGFAGAMAAALAWRLAAKKWRPAEDTA